MRGSRLRPLDRWLIAVLFPLWTIGFVLHVREAALGRLAWVGVVVASPAEPGGLPIVDAFQPGWGSEISGLQRGDRISRLGEVDMRGVGPLRFPAIARAEADEALSVPVAFLRGGELRRASLPLRRVPSPWGYAAISAGFALSGLVIVLRAPGSVAARAAFPAFVFFAFMFMFFHGPALRQTYAWMACSVLSFVLAPPAILRLLLLTPEEVPRPSRATLAATWGFSLLGVSYPSWLFGFPLSHAVGRVTQFGFGAIGLGAILVTVLRSYALAGPVGRRQVKWFFLAGYLSIAPQLVGSAITLAIPDFWGSVTEYSLALLVLIPVGVATAIHRSGLFDIDRLLSATASFSGALALGIGVMLVLFNRAGAELASATGTPPTIVQSALGAALALGVVSATVRLRPLVQQWLFPEAEALTTGLIAIALDLRDARTVEEVAQRVAAHLQPLLQPTHCSAYVRRDEDFARCFGSGEARVPRVRAASPLPAALQVRGRALRNRERCELPARGRSRIDDEALAYLDAALALPFRVGDFVPAFIVLGPKRSGDLYTNTEIEALMRLIEQTLRGVPHGPNASAPVARTGLRDALQAVVVIERPGVVGSGFFVSHDGHILTNHHVVGDEPVVRIRRIDGSTERARVLAAARGCDLALLRASAVPRPIPLGESRALSPGDPVTAIGSPVTELGTLSHTVTRGIVSALRALPSTSAPARSVRYVQTDTALNRGNSGGPLLDAEQRVIAVCAFKETGVDREGLNFAVAIEEALAEFAELRAALRG